MLHSYYVMNFLNKKPFAKYWVVACILDFWFIVSTHWLPVFYEMKTFFLWIIGRMGYNKSVLLYWFQKCTFDLSKKCIQKKFCPKNRFSWDLANFSISKTFFGENFFWVHFLPEYFNWQNIFLAKTFFACTFYQDQIYTFEISMKRRIFLPHTPFLKKKSFHLSEGTMNTFWELKGSKMQETAQYFEKRFFYEQVLDFHFHYMPHIEITKFCQSHWSLPIIHYWTFCVRSYLDSLDAITILIKTQVQWPALEDQIRV
jgi:hypothetical protein